MLGAPLHAHVRQRHDRALRAVAEHRLSGDLERQVLAASADVAHELDRLVVRRAPAGERSGHHLANGAHAARRRVAAAPRIDEAVRAAEEIADLATDERRPRPSEQPLPGRVDAHEARLRVDQRERDGRRVHERLEVVALVDERLLGGPLDGLVAEHEHDAVDAAFAVEDRRAAVGDGKIGAVASEQRGVVLQERGLAVAQHAPHRALDPLARLLVHDVEDLLDGAAEGLGERPAGQRLGGGVQGHDPPCGVGRDDAVADAHQHGAVALLGATAGLLRGVQRAEVRPLASQLDQHGDRGERRDEREQPAGDHGGAEPGWSEGLVRCLLGDEKPGRAGDGQRDGDDLDAAVIAAAHGPARAAHGHDLGKLAALERKAKRERRLARLADTADDRDALPLAAHEQGLRARACLRPVLDQGQQAGRDVGREDDRSERAVRGVGVPEDGSDRADAQLAVAAAVNVCKRRVRLVHRAGHRLAVLGVDGLGPFHESQDDGAAGVDEQQVVVAVARAHGAEPAKQRLSLLTLRIDEDLRDRLRDAWDVRDDGGVGEALGAPRRDAVHLELRDAAELRGRRGLGARALRAVLPHPDREDQRGDDASGGRNSRRRG